MLTILAAICFFLGALMGFGVLSGLSAVGLIALGLFFLCLAGWERVPVRYR